MSERWTTFTLCAKKEVGVEGLGLGWSVEVFGTSIA